MLLLLGESLSFCIGEWVSLFRISWHNNFSGLKLLKSKIWVLQIYLVKKIIQEIILLSLIYTLHGTCVSRRENNWKRMSRFFSVPTLYQTTERQRKMPLKAMRDILYMNKFTWLSKLPRGGRLFPLPMLTQVHSHHGSPNVLSPGRGWRL